MRPRFKQPAILLASILLVSSILSIAHGGLREAIDRKALIVAMPARDVYPYCYKGPDGTLQGSEVDMAADIARRLGVDLRVDRTAADIHEIIARLTSGEADLGISGIKVLLPYLAKTSMSRPYMEVKYTLIVNRLRRSALGQAEHPLQILQEDLFLKRLHGERGRGWTAEHPLLLLQETPCKRVATLDKDEYERYINELFPGSKVVRFREIEEMVEAVSTGRVEAAFCDEIESRAIYRQRPDLGVSTQLVPLGGLRDDIALAMSWRDRAFQRWLNLYLNTYPPGYSADGLLEDYVLP